MPEEPTTIREPDAGGNAPVRATSPASSSSLPRNPFVAVRAHPRRAIGVVAVCVLAVVGLVAVGLVYRPNAGGVVIAGPANVVLGSDGLPSEVDDQRVYRLAENAEWQDLKSSFLLVGYMSLSLPSCPPRMAPQPSAESDLLGFCGGFELDAGPGSGGFAFVAPKSVAAYGWRDGPAVVMRVHTHDAEAAGCSAGELSMCDSAIVVEAVVWPTVPTKIGGEHVYRVEDQPSFKAIKGSFLLGGPFTKRQVETPCPTPVAGEPEAEAALFGSICTSRAIDGLDLAAKRAIDEPNDEIVVARVHLNVPLAAKCPADRRADCDSAIVVESVVWRAPAN